ncbi:thiamine pyrophosphate-dependent enzyme [Halorubrum ezzemoulense]|jgi:pyruvate dehydrogenase E1 component alpha subunit|uniref:Pyruvate dehydrogenase (Acetyl-transferring) E1 component subunit alpha n=2 Tax=Halorubrum TaxID=56688 RepID=A0A256JYR6_HALEZ|nr:MULTISPECIES: thiamine pyrophosphate-dependent enzyme [Halorubrum]MDB2244676.1 thiamine pyrophosphate-dependent enzyme [Halorubrum ezzemoulense]MDB2250883.1 thiamine pyrophosphate-dependent enzyme [Halorubrum ezzemoulense]MDB2260945.1 thiamine pyrophosphate-dependent enzyme [Halorubrum ezzemoulense]MDB2268976.1 thiamine pyrophosphate-dependent enzyme [Halorubrum ezzemoulense]MDB2278567.1 thiamine pyrophosphate-dependent enzyme [Halorubrum ezzemoulense]
MDENGVDDAGDGATDPLADEDVYRVLGPDGSPLPDATVPDLSDERFRAIYRDLVVTRRFDERAVSLQRQGRIGTYAPCAGQEGSAVGSTHALADRDLISYQYREHGAAVVRDLLSEYLPYWMGHEAGTEAIADGNVFPLNIGIAAHLPHAVGAAWAFAHRDEDRVVACHFGDGATSEGDFHEAMNFAGVFDTPTVFCCHNNGWAISVPRGRQTASDTFAGKATAYGFDGVRADGMDPLASYAVTREAAERARRGGDGDGGDEVGGNGTADDPRPVLIEFVEYRFGAHTTADDPTAYRDADDVDPWRALDPLDRMEAFLRETDRIDDEGVAAIREEADDVVAAAIDAAESVEADPAAMFDHAFAGLSPETRRQRDDLLAAVAERGEEAFLREE